MGGGTEFYFSRILCTWDEIIDKNTGEELQPN
jgi:hypothetical protein